MDNTVYPVSLETLAAVAGRLGFAFKSEADRQRVTVFVQGQHARLIVHANLGVMKEEGLPWYIRFLTFSPDFEPLKAGIPPDRLMHWINDKNAELLFGRYYLDERTDTVAFEIAIPANGGILGEDLTDLFWIATASVDQAHKDLIALAETPKPSAKPAARRRTPSPNPKPRRATRRKTEG
jgi:hypothetical protein